MKYNIDEIKNSKVIKSVDKVKGVNGNVLVVNYLDGTQDVLDFNEENLNTILNIREAQANTYVEGSSKGKTILIDTILNIVFVSSIIATASITPNIYLFLALILEVACLVVANVGCIQKVRDINKYELFLTQVKNRLDEYNDILKKEKSLTIGEKGKNKQTKTVKAVKRAIPLNGYNDLDKISLNELKAILDKLERNEVFEAQEELSEPQKTLTEDYFIY